MTHFQVAFPYVPSGAIWTDDVTSRFPISVFWAPCRCALLWPARQSAKPAQIGGPVRVELWCGCPEKGTRLGFIYSSTDLAFRTIINSHHLACAEQHEEVRSCLKELLIHLEFSYRVTTEGFFLCQSILNIPPVAEEWMYMPGEEVVHFINLGGGPCCLQCHLNFE